jgi:hypothetical protein
MFIPRHPVVENQFCSYGTSTMTGSAGVGGVLCYAGSVLWLDEDATNQEPIVYRYDTYASLSNKQVWNSTLTSGTLSTTEKVPFGFAMQKVKTGYHQVHPTGFSMPGDLGSSDVIAQPSYSSTGTIQGTKPAPLGVAHLGIWDTVHYVCEHSANVVSTGNEMLPGQYLYVAANNSGKVTNHATNATDDSLDYEDLLDVTVARVVKGASAAKCSANIANTTLYPIRIKLLI